MRDIHFGLKVYAPPSIEPIPFNDAVLQLRVDPSTDEEPLILGLIQAAREYVEGYCSRRLIRSTWDLTLDRFPCYRSFIEVPYSPLVSVTSLTYIDFNGDTQTMDAADYIVDEKSEPGRVALPYGTIWPVTQRRVSAVTIRHVVGYGAAEASVPASIIAAMKLLIAHWFQNREAVVIGAGLATATVPLAVEALLSRYRVVAL